MLELRDYRDEDGHSAFRDWFDRLPAVAAARVTAFLERLAMGNTSNLKGWAAA